MGILMGFLCGSYAIPCYVYDLSMGFLWGSSWEFHDISMIFLWDYYGMPIESRLKSNESKLKSIESKLQPVPSKLKSIESKLK